MTYKQKLSRTVVAAIVAIICLSGCDKGEVAPVNDTPSADTVLINGKILTVDANFSIANSLAISGERIIVVGDNATVEKYIGDTTEVIDLGGRTVIPGLIDNHMHFMRGVERWHQQARIDNIDTRAEALNVIATRVATMDPGEWVMVEGGWSPGQFVDQPGGFTLAELDTIAPQNPLFIQLSYFTIYANSLALQAIDLSPADGAERPASGLISFSLSPDGTISFSQSPGTLLEQFPAVTDAQRRLNLIDYMSELNMSGLTGVYALGAPGNVLQELAQEGPLPLRIWHTLGLAARDPAGADAGVELLQQRSANTFDGNFGLYGVAEHVYLPFFDSPWITESWDPVIMAEYMKLAGAAAEGGWHIQQHTMTNISIGDLLDGFEILNETLPIPSLRWTIAHVFELSEENLERANALGLTFGIHGVSMNAGSPQVGEDGKLIGPTGPPVRAIQDSGAIWGLGTDATVVSHYQPFLTLGWVVSGLNLANSPVLQPTVTREEALIAHTRSNAYLFFQEDNLGTLEAGKYADLVVLDRDYMTIPAEEIKKIVPLMTMTGGRVVFNALHHGVEESVKRGWRALR